MAKGFMNAAKTPSTKEGSPWSDFIPSHFAKVRKEAAKKAYCQETAKRAKTQAKGLNLKLYTDYYDILRLKSTCTQREIKDAYFALARTHHPDKNKGIVSQKMQQEWTDMCLAYHSLKNPSDRKEYDSHSAIRAAVTSFYKRYNPV